MVTYAAQIATIPTLKSTTSTQRQSNANNWYGNGWTAMYWANIWYPGWSAYNFRWYNNCFWVYMKEESDYKTVYIGPNYTWHYDRNGYYW